VAANAAGATGVLDAADAVTELFAYFAELIEQRRRDPGDDTISMLVRGFDETRKAGFAMRRHDTTPACSAAPPTCSRHPGQRARLVADPAGPSGVVDELLRSRLCPGSGPHHHHRRRTARVTISPGAGDAAVRVGQTR
jgi:hypothetical protein